MYAIRSYYGTLIYLSVEEGMAFASHSSHHVPDRTDSPFDLFLQFMQENLHHPLAVLLLQIIVVLLAVRFFSYLFKHIHQPGVVITSYSIHYTKLYERPGRSSESEPDSCEGGSRGRSRGDAWSQWLGA